MLLRPARPGDEMDVARVHVRSWQSAYRHVMPCEYLDALRPEDRAAHYTFGTIDPAAPFTIVAVEAGRVAGFATTGPARHRPQKDCGELYALYVDPDLWGCGIGRSLLAAARDHLAAQGLSLAVLSVLAANLRARRFYEKDGWTTDGASHPEIIWEITVESVHYHRLLQPQPELRA